jgi:hypothetical protein
MNRFFRRGRTGLPRAWLWSGLLLLTPCAGCGYPEVSPRTYQLSKALYSACNLEQSDRLEIVGNLINSSLAASEITEAESEWLREIVSQGEAGQWKAASEQARRILEDQIGRSGEGT